MSKEYLYIGHYIDVNDKYVLKVGTTDNPKRRQKQHNRYYPNADKHPMKQGTIFQYDWKHKLSHANTLKYEALIKEDIKAAEVAEYVANDRFVFEKKPDKIYLQIRKTWEVEL